MAGLARRRGVWWELASREGGTLLHKARWINLHRRAEIRDPVLVEDKLYLPDKHLWAFAERSRVIEEISGANQPTDAWRNLVRVGDQIRTGKEVHWC